MAQIIGYISEWISQKLDGSRWKQDTSSPKTHGTCIHVQIQEGELFSQLIPVQEEELFSQLANTGANTGAPVLVEKIILPLVFVHVSVIWGPTGI